MRALSSRCVKVMIKKENMPNIDDISLVTRVIVFDDRRAFDRLVVKYQSPIRRFFLNQTLGDSQLSDDLAQDTFVKAYTNISQVQGRSGVSAWLYRVAYNVFYDNVRRRKETADIDSREVLALGSATDSSPERMDIYSAMALLSDSERTCITLQLMEGQPIERIADITGMAQGTVKSHLFRGKQKLADYLRKNGYGK